MLKILDMANLIFLETYNTWGPDLREVEGTFVREAAIFQAVDHILSPHDLLSRYLAQEVPHLRDIERKPRAQQ